MASNIHLSMALVVLMTSMRTYSVFCETPPAECQSEHVTTYVMAFLGPGPAILPSLDDVELTLVLTNPSNQYPVKVKVVPSGQSLTLSPNMISVDLVFNGSTALNGSMKDERGGGLLVTACHNDAAPMVVHGTVKTKFAAMQANAAFSVPPVSSLGSDYRVLTHCLHNHCLLAIVATAAQNITRVNVTLRIRHSDDANSTGPSVTYNGARYEDGQVIEEELQQLQAMQVLCFTCDLSGSHVTASSPVAVIAGGELTTIDNSSISMDTVLEFLPPTSALGRQYTLAKDKEKRFVAKVVALHDDTVFTIASLGDCFEASAAGEVWELPLTQLSQPTTLESSHPLLVSLLTSQHSQTSDDASLTVLLPAAQWDTSGYQVIQPFNTELNELLVVADLFSLWLGCLRLNGSHLTSLAGYQLMKPVSGTLSTCVVTVSLGSTPQHAALTCATYCQPCQPFWGYVMGAKNSFKRGWAMPLGIFSLVNPEQSEDNEVPAACRSLVTMATSSASTPAMTTPSVSPTTQPHLPVITSTTLTTQVTTNTSLTMTSTEPAGQTEAHRPKYLCPCTLSAASSKTAPHPDQSLALLSQTSRQRNRKLCVPDTRLSATVIGSGGVFVLVAVLMFFVCADVTNLLGMSSAKFRFHGHDFT